MARIIAVANQKGGVAKTTTVHALGSGLKRKGFRVLCVDLDPQGNLSDSVNAHPTDGWPTVYELLKREAEIHDVVRRADAFDLAAADIVLASADRDPETGNERLLKDALEPVVDEYDYIVIDTPPALNLLTVNAFVAADEVIVTTTAGIFSAKGINELHKTVLQVKKRFNQALTVRGILFTKHNPRTVNGRDLTEAIEKLAQTLDVPVFKTRIRNSVAIEEAQTSGADLFTYRDSAAVRDYAGFVDEFLDGEQRE